MQNNYDLDCYMPISAGLIIKLITVVIYGFHNRLECLSLSTILKACQGQTLQLITESVNYGCNKFYDTGPTGFFLKGSKLSLKASMICIRLEK